MRLSKGDIDIASLADEGRLGSVCRQAVSACAAGTDFKIPFPKTFPEKIAGRFVSVSFRDDSEAAVFVKKILPGIRSAAIKTAVRICFENTGFELFLDRSESRKKAPEAAIIPEKTSSAKETRFERRKYFDREPVKTPKEAVFFENPLDLL
jgi:hypothetical protein